MIYNFDVSIILSTGNSTVVFPDIFKIFADYH